MITVNDQIIQQIAREMGLDEDVVRKAVDAQFKIVKKGMESEDPVTIRLQYLGKFKADKRRIEHFNKRKNE